MSPPELFTACRDDASEFVGVQPVAVRQARALVPGDGPIDARAKGVAAQESCTAVFSHELVAGINRGAQLLVYAFRV